MRRLLSHTADLGAEISAPDLPSLYGEAVQLVRELLVGRSPVRSVETKRIPLASGSEVERLFLFVRELLFLADSERFLPAEARLHFDAVFVAGEPFDAARHAVERQIKALTRHRFDLEESKTGWVARMVFDL